MRFAELRVLFAQRAQYIAGTYLHKNSVAGLQRLADTFCESNGLTELPGPIIWIGRFGIGNPAPHRTRDKRNPRRSELEPAHELGEFAQDRIHHARMKCMRDPQPAMFHPLLCQRLLERSNRAVGSRHDALLVRVDTRERELAVEQRYDIA